MKAFITTVYKLIQIGNKSNQTLYDYSRKKINLITYLLKYP